MPRKPRIEYAGAIYHVMCRGDKREAIFLSDRDREMFLDTLGEVCERAGWRIHSYILMTNHYHIELETPEANLVEGMKWFQGTYTQRFHSRNKTCGHVFQGRYKALPVLGKQHYLSTLSTYIHLNPVRAGMLLYEESQLSDYVWSSYPYYLRPTRRPSWLSVDRVFAALQMEDTANGRRKYKRYMRRRELEILGEKRTAELENEWKELRRGWFYGDEKFRIFLKDHLHILPGKRDSYSGEEMRDHDEAGAERLLEKGLKVLGRTLDEIHEEKYSDTDKCLLAWLLRQHTVVSNGWICERLRMGRVDCFSRYPKKIQDTSDRKIKRKKAQLGKIL